MVPNPGPQIVLKPEPDSPEPSDGLPGPSKPNLTIPQLADRLKQTRDLNDPNSELRVPLPEMVKTENTGVYPVLNQTSADPYEGTTSLYSYSGSESDVSGGSAATMEVGHIQAGPKPKGKRKVKSRLKVNSQQKVRSMQRLFQAIGTLLH